MIDGDRVFLDWDQPLVVSAARWLLEAAAEELDSWWVAAPTRGCAERLLASMALELEPGTLGRPPCAIAVAELPEILVSSRVAVANESERWMAWHEALSGSAAVRRPATADHGERRDTWSLVAELVALEGELAAAGLGIGDIVETGRTLENFPEARWRHLAEVESAYRAALGRRKLADPLTAWRRGRLGPGKKRTNATKVCVVGVPDLPALTADLLEGVEEVRILIAAPGDERDNFDRWGRPVREAWKRRRLPLGRAEVDIVDRPRDQAALVAEKVLERQREGIPSGNVVVGVSSDDAERRIRRALVLESVPVASSRAEFDGSGPDVLLRRLGLYLENGRIADLCSLIRHPGFERALDGCIVAELEGVGGRASHRLREAVSDRDWLTVLDIYTTESLAVSVPVESRGELGDRAVEALRDAATELLECPVSSQAERRPLAAWTEVLRRMLTVVYGETPPRPTTVVALLSIGELLTELAAASVGTEAVFTLAEVVDVVRRRLGGRLRVEAVAVDVGSTASPCCPDADRDGITLLPWTEVAMSRADDVIVTGVNEGALPRPGRDDPWLTESLRGAMGLGDDQGRLAVDSFCLMQLLESRRLVLVAGRRDVDEEPLVPSRLLLACDEAQLPATVLEFWNERGAAPATVPSEERGIALTVPAPDDRAPLPTALAATAFRDYLACPYRFYLRHVLRLDASRDLPRELEPAQFGGLAHEVLRRFAKSSTVTSADPVRVFQALEDLLDEEAEHRLSSSARVAARIQIEQLRRRLRGFAYWQAGQVAGGWRIDADLVETRLERGLMVDDESILIRGRIDRVERHRDLGVRILDYKTGERARDPDATHLDGSAPAGWKDLQLPLYRFLLAGAGVEATSLGFLHLSQDLAREPLALATWSLGEEESALETARAVVRDVRRRVFWPPRDPPTWDDGFRGLAGDLWADRERLLRAVEGSSR